MKFEAATRAIRAGEVIGVPTDTVYGIGADPTSETAVGRLFALKGRPERKPIGLLLSDLAQAEDVAELGILGSKLAGEHWPGALTLVVAMKARLARWVGDPERGTVGVRVPDHALLREILDETGPLAVTSANVAGGAETRSDVEARELFDSGVAVYVEGVSPGGVASTVVDVTGEHPMILRQGPVHI